MKHEVDEKSVTDAKEAFEEVMKTEWFQDRPQAVQELYKAYPPWKFYTNLDGTCARRVLGVEEYHTKEGSELRLKTVTCMFGWINDVVGGCCPSDLVPVERYVDAMALMKLSLTNGSQYFMDPNGWVALLHSN